MTRRRYLLGGLLGLAIAAGIVAGVAVLVQRGDGLPPKTFIVAGTVRLTGQAGFQSGQPCAGAGAYADLRDGAAVTVSGPGGETLSVGELIDGTGTVSDTGVDCVWHFFVVDVNADRDRYLVEVTNRGRHPYDVSSIHGRIDLVVTAR
jgi:hypothetical protein